MKKAKVILAAIAVLFVGGSALAIQSQKAVNATIYLAPAAGQPATLTVEATITASTVAGAAQTWATTQFNATNASFTYTIARN